MMTKRTRKRFFTSQALQTDSTSVLLDARETHHLHRVLRLKPGDECFIFNPTGHEWRAQVSGLSKEKRMVIKLIEPVTPVASLSVRLTMAQAIPQRAKMDCIVEKAAELGVARVIPIVTERTMIKIRSEDTGKVVNRWRRIVQEAMKQSKNETATEIAEPVTFREWLASCGLTDKTFVFHPEHGKTLWEAVSVLRQALKKKESFCVNACVGPEGGFTEAEYQLAVASGAEPVRLGANILKTDTAFVTIASALTIGML